MDFSRFPYLDFLWLLFLDLQFFSITLINTPMACLRWAVQHIDTSLIHFHFILFDFMYLWTFWHLRLLGLLWLFSLFPASLLDLCNPMRCATYRPRPDTPFILVFSTCGLWMSSTLVLRTCLYGSFLFFSISTIDTPTSELCSGGLRNTSTPA